MKTPSCDDCNGACCRTFWLPRQVGELWVDRDFIATRAIDLITVAGQDFRVLPAQCPMLQGNRCGVYRFRPKTCEEYAVGGAMCLASIRLNNPTYFEALREEPKETP